MTDVYQPFQEVLESQMSPLLQEDSDYEYYATPLKPAKAIKQAHANQLKEFIKFKEIHTQLDKAAELIPQLISDSTVKNELDQSGKNFFQSIEEEKEASLQEMFGLSDETLIQIYAKSVELIENKNFEEAFTLLVFLTTLAPHVPSYWIAEGVCLQNLTRHAEAIEVFNVVKLLGASHLESFTYAIESHLALKNKDGAKQALEEFKEALNSYEGEDKRKWENSMSYYGGVL